MKRSRGRGRRSGGGGNNPNRHFESNGPGVKIRGSAQQILDKYQQYARDAQSSGDRVDAENYLQHAEHYYRVLAAIKPPEKPKQEHHRSNDAKSEGGDTAKASDGGDSAPTEEAASASSSEDQAANSEAAAEPAKKPTKPRTRRSYKKKTSQEAPDTPDDGVAKTLARGQKKAATDAADAPAESAD